MMSANRRIDLAVQLLEGKVRLVTSQLEEEMQKAAEELQFEEAAALRDRIAAIKVLGKRQASGRQISRGSTDRPP